MRLFRRFLIGIGCGAILLMFLLLAGCLALFSSPPEETANVEVTAEEATQEETIEETALAKESTREETITPPRPRTPEEQLRSKIQKVFSPEPTEGPKILQDLQIQNNNGQCYDIYVKFRGEAPLGSNYDYIEFRMEDIYKAAYLERDLANRICTVKTEATTELTDKRGNTSRETALITSLDRATAATLNWKNVDNIDFPSVWSVEYESTSLQQEKAQDAIDQAVDCADNGGLFDFDFLQCP
jgi:hypothetical protein